MISREICQRVLAKAVSTGADYAEIFAENTTNHSISMIASKVDAVKDTVIAGASVRLYKGMRSVIASTVDTVLDTALNRPASVEQTMLPDIPAAVTKKTGKPSIRQ